MSSIVVPGGGIGGLSAAFELKDELGDELVDELVDELGERHEIVLVSDQDVFEFTPSNPRVAVNCGAIPRRSAWTSAP